MSISAVAFAFAQHLPATQKWLLVCLADYADDWGDSIFASLEELADRTELSRATLQRTFRELLKTGVLVRVARSTPFSPPFYRIVMPDPEPGTAPRRERDCPNALRASVKYAFGHVCEYCKQPGTPEKGPDGHRWTVDRLVPGKEGGRYVPENVTLACRFCNTKKRTGIAPAGTRSLADLARTPGPQSDASVSPDIAATEDTSGAAPEDPGGIAARPDPLSDPLSDPSSTRKAGAAPQLASVPDSPDDNVSVITRLAHETYDVLGVGADDIDLAETLKSRCATLRIAYNSTVVRKALDSAKWQREHAGSRT